MRKCSRTDVELYNEYLVYLDEHPAKHIYTIGQKHNTSVLQLCSKTIHTVDDVGKESNFTPEMYAIRTALRKISDSKGKNGSFIIFSDSPSTLLALKLGEEVSPIAEETKAIIH